MLPNEVASWDARQHNRTYCVHHAKELRRLPKTIDVGTTIAHAICAGKIAPKMTEPTTPLMQQYQP